MCISGAHGHRSHAQRTVHTRQGLIRSCIQPPKQPRRDRLAIRCKHITVGRSNRLQHALHGNKRWQLATCAGYLSHPASFSAWKTHVASTGMLTVESQLGQGTTFQLAIPLATG
jgi:hypothetical protein